MVLVGESSRFPGGEKIPRKPNLPENPWKLAWMGTSYTGHFGEETSRTISNEYFYLYTIICDGFPPRLGGDGRGGLHNSRAKKGRTLRHGAPGTGAAERQNPRPLQGDPWWQPYPRHQLQAIWAASTPTTSWHPREPLSSWKTTSWSQWTNSWRSSRQRGTQPQSASLWWLARMPGCSCNCSACLVQPTPWWESLSWEGKLKGKLIIFLFFLINFSYQIVTLKVKIVVTRR